MKKIWVIFLLMLFFSSSVFAETNTTILNLKKPDLTDEYDIGVPNSNMDIIDTALGTQHEITGEHKTITPKVDNTSDLGSSSLAFQDAFIKRNISDGTNTTTVAYIKNAVDNRLQSGRIAGMNMHLKFTIIDPAIAYTKSTTICIWNKTDSAIHITNIEFRCNADPDTEVTGDIKYADSLIGLANATLIAAIDTTAGSFSSGAIDVAVGAGKCIYLLYDTDPDAATTQHTADITYDYD